MLDGTEDELKNPYEVGLPNGMKLVVELEHPNKTRLQIRFHDGTGVDLRYSGKEGEKGTVRPIGQVTKEPENVDDNTSTRWSPSALSVREAAIHGEAYCLTGDPDVH